MIRKKEHYHIRKKIGNSYVSLCNLIFSKFYDIFSNTKIRFIIPLPYEIMVFEDGKEDFQERFKYKRNALKRYNQLIKN